MRTSSPGTLAGIYLGSIATGVMRFWLGKLEYTSPQSSVTNSDHVPRNKMVMGLPLCAVAFRRMLIGHLVVLSVIIVGIVKVLSLRALITFYGFAGIGVKLGLYHVLGVISLLVWGGT